MKKHFIQQLAFAVAFTAIASLFNSVQAQTTSTFENLVLRNSNVSGTYTSDGTPWHDLTGYWVDAITGEYFTGNSSNYESLFRGKTFYFQDVNKTKGGYSTINTSKQLEVKANISGVTKFAGDALYVGYYQGDIYDASGSYTGSTDGQFSTKQMRLSLRIDASGFNDETQIHYDPDKAVDLSNVYLGNGIINNRLIEGDYVNYATVGLKGTLNVLPDPNIDSQTGEYDNVFRSVIANDNKNRHIVVDTSATINVPAGAKLEFRSESWDNNESHHPYSVFPVYGNVEGNGSVRYKAIREDTLFVYGTNDGFTEGTVYIYTDDNNKSTRYDHSYVISGNGAEGTGIKGSAVHIECGNLLIQNDHTLNNLSSDPVKLAPVLDDKNQQTGDYAWHYIRIMSADKMSYNTFIDVPEGFTRGQDLSPMTLTLNNTQETTYYGSICGAVANETTVDGVTVHDYDFTGSIHEVIKTGGETLNLYCAGSDGGIRAESFVLSSGRINFNGYFEGSLSVEAGTVFSPDSWNWGDDDAIQVRQVDDEGNTIAGGVSVFGNIKVERGGKIEFNFSNYSDLQNDVITFLTEAVNFSKGPEGEGTSETEKFDTSVGSIIDLEFLDRDPEAWATEDAKYLLIENGGFEDKYYNYLLTGKNAGPFDNGRHFALLGEDGNLYLVTVVPEPSTWALLILGAAGMLYWRKRKSN